MHKRLIQAATAAILFASLTAPAFASDGDHGRGNGFGLANKIRNAVKKELKLEARLEKHDDDDDDDEDDDDENVLSSCLRDAEKAHEAALKTAREERKATKEKARSTFHEAIKIAQKTRRTAMVSAHATFKASLKDEAAITVYVQAWVKAETDWQKARKAAQEIYDTAKVTAEAKWKEAKLKADAAFKTAKDKCKGSTPPPLAPPITPPITTDTIAPGVITTLTLSGPTATSLVAAWVAPGDDGSVGTAASYDIRYSTSPIATTADFNGATQVMGEPVPTVAGTTQSMTVSGLTAATNYYFAMKAQDEMTNVSVMSNVSSMSTL